MNRMMACIHPLSIEAISPTQYNDSGSKPKIGIHPLSIEAISPTTVTPAPQAESASYPSSVNRGYFSYERLVNGRSTS